MLSSKLGSILLVATVAFVFHSDAAPLPAEQQQSLINEIEQAAMAQIAKAGSGERPIEQAAVAQANTALKDVDSLSLGDHEVVEDMKREQTQGLEDATKIQQANQLDDAKDVKKVEIADADAQAMRKQIQNQVEHMDAALGEAIQRQRSTLSDLRKAKMTASKKKRQLGESDQPEMDFRDPGPGKDFGWRIHEISETANAAVQDAEASAAHKRQAIDADEEHAEALSEEVIQAMAQAKQRLDVGIQAGGDVAIEQDIKHQAEEELQNLSRGSHAVGTTPAKSLGESMTPLKEAEQAAQHSANEWVHAQMKQLQQQNPLSAYQQQQAGTATDSLQAVEQEATTAAGAATTTTADPSQAAEQEAETVSGVSTLSAKEVAARKAAEEEAAAAEAAEEEAEAVRKKAAKAAEEAEAARKKAADNINNRNHQAIAMDVDKLKQFQASALKEMDNQQALIGKVDDDLHGRGK